jgi:FMN reductase
MMSEESSAWPGSFRLLAIGGSMRMGSHSLHVLKAALQLAQRAGAQGTLANVRDLALPVYDPELSLDAYPPSLPWLLDEVRAADALLLCSPTYHGTIAGSVKNVLDALEFLASDTPPYLEGKVVGLIAFGGGVNVINDLTLTTRALHGLIVPTVVTVPRAALDPATGEIHVATVRRRLERMVAEVVALAPLARRLHRLDLHG